MNRQGGVQKELIQLYVKKTDMNCFSSNLSLYPAFDGVENIYLKLGEQINIIIFC